MKDWVPTTRDHLAELEVQPAQVAAADVIEQILKDADLYMLLPEYGRTLIVDGKAVGVFGAWPVRRGTADVWALLSLESLEYPKALASGARHWMDAIVKRDRWWRLQTLIDPEHVGVRRWIHWLGFEREGWHEGAGPDGRDLVSYARVF